LLFRHRIRELKPVRVSRKGLGIFLLAFLMGTLYAVLMGLIFRSQAAPVFSWPVWIGFFWLLFNKFGLLRFSGFIAVLPVSLLAFEIVRSVRYPGASADRHKSIDRSHYTPGLQAKNPQVSDGSNGPKEILIGRDGFRADPETGRGNPERCRFVLIGDSMIYGTGLAYPLTVGPVLADMGLLACVFGVTGNSPLDYVATLKYVAARIEPGAYVAIYLYAYNDFVSLHRFFERGVLTTSSWLNKLLDWAFYFDRWRHATWTYSLFREAPPAPPTSFPQHQIVEEQPIKTLDSRDSPPYVTPKPLNRRHRFALSVFLSRLNEFVNGRPWRVSVLIHPDYTEIYANFARSSPVFVDLDPRRAEGLKMCKEFPLQCEDISRYIYERSFAERKNPYLDHDRHFSAFGTRVVAEHFAALTKRALPPGER
jgi:hypothetical protein